MKIIISGIVQGVGFRPTVYRVAKALNLKGYVLNKGSEVEICVDKNADEFINRLTASLPSIARIDSIKIEDDATTCTLNDFVILDSKEGARISTPPPETAICADCLKELLDKNN
ncbi:MAG: acylphosphatase, partial [Candidatus Thermoplasmatota archaeon]